MLSSRCSTCPKKYNLVLGDGPIQSRVMIIGEAPGREEDGVGRPFIGQAGREFNENYLSLAGLRRDEVFVSNSVKCRPDLNRKPGQKELWGCANHHIPGELDEVSPEVVILLGATACSLVPEIDLEVEHGIPSKRRLYNWEGWVVPLFHPAAGLHQTEMMIYMLEDWAKLASWLDEDQWMWASDDVARIYNLAKTKSEVIDYFK